MKMTDNPENLNERQLLEAIYNNIIVIHKRLDFIELKIIKTDDYKDSSEIHYSDTFDNIRSEISDLKNEFSAFNVG